MTNNGIVHAQVSIRSRGGPAARAIPGALLTHPTTSPGGPLAGLTRRRVRHERESARPCRRHIPGATRTGVASHTWNLLWEEDHGQPG